MKALKEVRQQKGLTLVELARMAGVSQGHINQVERGVKMPTLRVAKKLAKALAGEEWDKLLVEMAKEV